MNLDELNVLFASAWSAEEKAQMFEGLVRGSNGLVAPESAPGPLRDANALGLKWREEAETFMRKAEEGGKKSAAARASRFGTSQPPSGNSRTPFEESSNQATSYKLQAENNKQQGDLAPLDAGMSLDEQQPESDAASSTGTTPSQTLAQTPDQPLSSRATPPPPSSAGPLPLVAETIYSHYPRKIGKADALKAIAKAIKQDGYQVILDATMEYASAVARWPDSEKQYVPHPSTWFNRASYLDDRSEWTKKCKRLPQSQSAKRFLSPAEMQAQEEAAAQNYTPGFRS